MATKKIKRFRDGGVSDKDSGLKASKGEKVGFFERLRMGNIDDEGSEAYRRFGAGRGKAERTPVEDRVATPTAKRSAPVAQEGVIVTPIPASPAQQGSGQTFGQAFAAARKAGNKTFSFKGKSFTTETKEDVDKRRSNKARQQATEKKERETNRIKRSVGDAVSKAEAKKFDAANRRSATRLLDSQKGVSDISNQSSASAIPGQSVKSPVGEKVVKISDEKRQLLNMLGATGATAGLGIVALRRMAQAKRAREAGVKKRVNLKRDTEEGIAQNRALSAKDLAAKQSTTAERTRKLRAGQAKTKFTSESKKPSKRTKKFDDSESNVEFKRGGSVAKASKRADGICTKGKTKGKMV